VLFAGAATTLVGGALGITLMACYGCPPSQCIDVPDDASTDARVGADAHVGDPDAGSKDAGDAGRDSGNKDAGDAASDDAGDTDAGM
jgi:hypothetical protein